MTTTTVHPPRAAAPAKTAGIPFRRLLRVEWSKTVDTRSARWLLAITALATVGLTLVPILAQHDVHQSWENYVQFPVFGMTTLLPVVAILTVTTEWTQRTVLTTFTQEPRRGRVLTAKLGALVGLSIVASAFAGAVIAVAAAVAHADGRHLDGHLGLAQVTAIPLYVLLEVLLGAVFGALLQNSAATIVALFAVPIGLGFLGNAVSVVHDWIDPDTALGHVLQGDYSGHGTQIAVTLLLWIALPLAAGFGRTVRREVN